MASGIISTIGPKNASYIVKQFGKKSLDIVFDETDRLIEVKGIGKKSIEKIKKSVEELKFSKNILFNLTGLGISLSLSKKIYNIFRENTLKVINEYVRSEYGVDCDLHLERPFMHAALEKKQQQSDFWRKPVAAWFYLHLPDFFGLIVLVLMGWITVAVSKWAWSGMTYLFHAVAGWF